MSFLNSLKAAPAPIRKAAMTKKNGPAERFVAKIKQQRGYITQTMAGNTQSGRKAWFIQDGDTVKYKFLRSPLEINGTEWFETASLTELDSIYAAAIAAVEAKDADFLALIEARAVEDQKAASTKGLGRKAKAKP